MFRKKNKEKPTGRSYKEVVSKWYKDGDWDKCPLREIEALECKIEKLEQDLRKLHGMITEDYIREQYGKMLEHKKTVRFEINDCKTVEEVNVADIVRIELELSRGEKFVKIGDCMYSSASLSDYKIADREYRPEMPEPEYQKAAISHFVGINPFVDTLRNSCL